MQEQPSERALAPMHLALTEMQSSEQGQARAELLGLGLVMSLDACLITKAIALRLQHQKHPKHTRDGTDLLDHSGPRGPSPHTSPCHRPRQGAPQESPLPHPQAPQPCCQSCQKQPLNNGQEKTLSRYTIKGPCQLQAFSKAVLCSSASILYREHTSSLGLLKLEESKALQSLHAVCDEARSPCTMANLLGVPEPASTPTSSSTPLLPSYRRREPTASTG